MAHVQRGWDRPDRPALQRDRQRLRVRRAAVPRGLRADRRGGARPPADPYALTKLFGEQLLDAAVARSDVRAISIHPWRDYLAPDGALLPAVRERLARGETGVQRGRAALS